MEIKYTIYINTCMDIFSCVFSAFYMLTFSILNTINLKLLVNYLILFNKRYKLM